MKNVEALLAHVRDTEIQFVTMRPPRSQFTTLERRVVVTGPAELVELARMGDRRVLDKLIDLLQQPDRAWAAVVLLAAMTGHESKIIDSYATSPQHWWAALGETAHDRWAAWLQNIGTKLVWDAAQGMFRADAADSP
ncbi:MAG: hypothetical protein SH847_13820 [Roseiflexaceae bacterium]|nr:hypothetical protein [Roseiflexaceae bacterium]